MWVFLKRVFGTTDEGVKAEQRYKKAQEELEKRDQELDELLEQVKCSTSDHAETKEELSKTRTDLTATLSKTISGEIEAVTDEEIEEFENARPSNEGTPSPAGV